MIGHLAHTLLHVVLFLLGLGLIKLSTSRNNENDRGALFSAYVLAYVARVAVIVLLHLISPDGLFMLDDRAYNEQATYLAGILPDVNISDVQAELETQHVAYPFIVGLTYLIGGHSILSAKLLNAFFGALLVPVLYWLTAELGEPDSGLPRRVAWLAALFPFDIAWAAFLMRDTILEFVFTLLLACTLAGLKQRSYMLIGCATSLLYLMNFFRFYATYVWCGAVLLAGIAWLSRKANHAQPPRAWLWFIGINITGLVLLSVVFPFFENFFPSMRLFSASLEILANSPDAKLLVFSFTPGYVSSLVRAILVYFFSPVPLVLWGGAALTDYVLYPGMFVLYVLFPFFAVGLWRLVRGLDPLKVFLISAFVLHAAVEIYVFQSGTRQKVMTDGIFLLCAAVAWPDRHALSKKLQLAYATLLFVALSQMAIKAFT
jgi:hypothetical protein